MNITDVAEELKTKLEAIAGLNVFSYPPGAPPIPAAIVQNPKPGEVEYVQTYGNGMQRMTMHLLVLVGSPFDYSNEKAIRAYLDGSGPKSVIAALDSSDSNEYESCDEVTVTVGGVDGYSYGDTPYLGAEFDIDVTGRRA